MNKIIGFLAFYFLAFKGKLSDFLSDSACKAFVTYGNDCKFRKNAKVENKRNDKSKIIIGNSVIVDGRLLTFKYGGEIFIGDYVYVGENSNIWSGESIIIGNNVLISHNVNIIDTNSHEINYLERQETYHKLITIGHSSNKGSIETSPITIGDNVWISYGVSILKGVNIGKGAIIASGSVVTKDVEPFTMVAGNPAKIVKKLAH